MGSASLTLVAIIRGVHPLSSYFKVVKFWFFLFFFLVNQRFEIRSAHLNIGVEALELGQKSNDLKTVEGCRPVNWQAAIVILAVRKLWVRLLKPN